MFSYSKDEMATMAKQLGFPRDTLEKVYRLVDVLEYLNANPATRDTLALKGGTSINLTIFNLPRLSVDIDLDYSCNDSRDEMLGARQVITEDLKKYMTTQGYSLSSKSKYRHSLDSFVFVYENLGGMSDNIKVEINYSLRAHILDTERRRIITEIEWIKPLEILSVAPVEIFAGKINALLYRAAARDLYDVHNMVRQKIFGNNMLDELRKSVIFYSVITQKTVPQAYSTEMIDGISQHKIRTELSPVIRVQERILLPEAQEALKSFISELMILTEREKEFLSRFAEKEYFPELLFEDEIILRKIRSHPMVQWKMQLKGN